MGSSLVSAFLGSFSLCEVEISSREEGFWSSRFGAFSVSACGAAGSFFSRTLPSSAHSSGDHSAFSSALEKVEVVEMKVVDVERNIQDPLQDSG